MSNGTIAAIKWRVRTANFATFVFAGFLALPSNPVRAEGLSQSKSRFVYKERSGKVTSARIIRRYWTNRIVHPFAHIDPRIDPKMVRAANIAQERANARTHFRCWQYVKEALVAAGAVGSYPSTAYAAEAGQELAQRYGFQRLSISDPYKAPLGAILVYGNRSRGHVEIRTRDGFVSDYHSKNRCFYPLIAVYGKFGS